MKDEIGYVCRSALRYLDRSVSRAMGCFFACFRVRDDRSRPHQQALVSSRPREAVVSSNRLSSLFLSEEREESPCTGRDNDVAFGSPEINKQLRDEAMFLKACGTLPKTPSEIRKATQKLKGSPPVNKDSEDLKFHSWLPDATVTKCQLSNQIDQEPNQIKLCQDWERASFSSERTPSSCISTLHTSGRISTDHPNEDTEAGHPKTMAMVNCNQTDSSVPFASPFWPTNAKSGKKSVRFDCDFDVASSKGSSSGSGCQPFERFNASENLSASKPTPKPTPLKLSDEMQTPGTIFPVTVDTPADGKTRIRSQYVYSVLNPVEHYSQWKLMKEDSSNSSQLSNDMRECREQLENTGTTPEAVVKDISSMKLEASLSSCLKPLSSTCDDHNSNIRTAASKNFLFGRTSGDRPIIGMVAAHWHENESTDISPKWWDGNGIPNSTNKYKEDQKVSWHATPFEERLEKALSEESFVPQKAFGALTARQNIVQRLGPETVVPKLCERKTRSF